MYKLFKRFDYLSSEVNFTFNFRGDIIHKTIFGGIISMLSIFISIIFSLYFFIVFIKKDAKYLITSTIHSDYLNFTDSNLVPIMLRMTDKIKALYSLQMKKLDFTNLIRLNLILILTMEQSKVLL